MERKDMSLSHKELFLQLQKEFRLLHLVWHRNKNQHRVSLWWKRLNMMKRNCGQVLEILQKPSIDKAGDAVRLYRLVIDFNRRQLSKTYYDFNGVIALGQFVTLGVVLVGLLSRVFSVYRGILTLYQAKFEDAGCLSRPAVSKAQDAVMSLMDSQSYPGMEELGEEVIEEMGEKPVQAMMGIEKAPRSTSSSKKTSKKKKKKSKSVIDSIFG